MVPQNFPNYAVGLQDEVDAYIIQTKDGKNQKFKLVAGGVAGADNVSFESVTKPGHYLSVALENYAGFVIKLKKTKKTAEYNKTATFKVVANETNKSDVSFESLSQGGLFIRYENFRLKISPPSGADFANQTSFKIISAKTDDESSKEIGTGEEDPVKELFNKIGTNIEMLAPKFPNYAVGLKDGVEGYLVETKNGVNQKFKLKMGIVADASTVSFESVKLPDHFLVASHYFNVSLGGLEDTIKFKKDASFKVVANSSNKSDLSFESVSNPGYFIRYENYKLKYSEGSGTDFDNETSFKIIPAKTDNESSQGSAIGEEDPVKKLLKKIGTSIEMVPQNFPNYAVGLQDEVDAYIIQTKDGKNQKFKLVAGGVAGADNVSFESVTKPGHYLSVALENYAGFVIKLKKTKKTAEYNKTATFKVVANETNKSDVSFESLSQGGLFIRYENFRLKISPPSGADFANQTSFKIISAKTDDESSKEIGTGEEDPVKELFNKIGTNIEMLAPKFPNYAVGLKDGVEGYLVETKNGVNQKFKLKMGIVADASTVSFESVKLPDHFLVASHYFNVSLGGLEDTIKFKKDASFKVVANSSNKSDLSFESVSNPGFFIRYENFKLKYSKGSGTEFDNETSFKIISAKTDEEISQETAVVYQRLVNFKLSKKMRVNTFTVTTTDITSKYTCTLEHGNDTNNMIPLLDKNTQNAVFEGTGLGKFRFFEPIESQFLNFCIESSVDLKDASISLTYKKKSQK